MRNFRFLLALSVIVAVGCNSDDEFGTSMKPLILEVQAEELGVTRTVLSDDGRSIFWDVNDSLSVFLGGDIMNCAVVYGVPDGRSAKFIVDGKFIIGGTTDDEGVSYTNVALYPYAESASMLDSDTLYTMYPAVQRAVLNSIPNGVPMIAATDNVTTTSFSFKNISSFIRFSVSSPINTEISHIVLSADLKPLSGEILVDVNSANYKIVGQSGNTITLDCNKIAIGDTPVVFFMSVLPIEFGDDEWSVELFDTNGGSMKFILPAFTFERNKFYTLNVNYVPA